MSPPFPSPPFPPSFFFSSHSLSGRAASEGPIQQGTAPAETSSGSSYNSEWIANHQGLRRHSGAALPPRPERPGHRRCFPPALAPFAPSLVVPGASRARPLAWLGDLRSGRAWGWMSWGCRRSGLRCTWKISVGVYVGVCVCMGVLSSLWV